MPKFGQKWPKMPQNATKSNLLGLYPKFLLPSFVDNQKSPFCVEINFWGASSLFKVFVSFMCGHPILFMAGTWSGGTPFFLQKNMRRERKELYSFEASGDYVMDVVWSPVS